MGMTPGTCFVIASVGRSELNDCILDLLPKLGPMDRIVVSLNVESADFSLDVTDPRLSIIEHRLQGASASRNFAVDSVLLTLPNDTYFVFPNDRSFYPSNSLEALRRFSKNESGIGVGSWEDLSGQIIQSPKKNYSNYLDFLNSYEPSLIVSSQVFIQGLRFKEEMGTGAKTPWQSGEAAALIFDAFDLNFEVHPVADFRVRNITTSANLKSVARIRKSFGYGMGYGFYCRKYGSGIGNLIPNFIHCASPLANFLMRKPYWTVNGFAFTVAATCGRLIGLLSPFKYS